MSAVGASTYPVVPLSADRQQITSFVGALFRHADDDGIVQMRAFRDDIDGAWRPERWRAVVINGSGLGSVVDAAEALASDCAAALERVVFASPVATFKAPGSAAEKDIANGLVLTVECDAAPAAARRALEALLGPATVIVASGGVWTDPATGELSDKLHLHWRLREPTREFPNHAKLKEARRLAMILVGADGSAVPLCHPLRWPGSWHRKGEPRLAHILELKPSSEIELSDALDLLRDAVEAAAGAQPTQLKPGAKTSSDAQADPLDIAAAATIIPNDDLLWADWNRILMAFWRASGGSETGFAAAATWSAKSSKDDPTETRRRWDHYRTSPPTEIGAGSLFHLARSACPGWKRPSDYVKCDAPGGGDTPDPNEDFSALIEKTATDLGAPFVPEVLERLVALRKEDRAAFEVLRVQLKKTGCRVTALDEVIAAASGQKGGRGPSQADILLELAQAAELFHAPDSTGFADLDVNGHRETWPIRAKGFRRWLARRFFEETQGAPSSEALQSALNVIEAKAHFDGPERVVHIRVGGLDDRLYLDLCDETWRAVEIDATGWRIISNPPVRFRRAAGMKPLPVPVRGGSVATLRSFLNIRSDADFVLVVAWLLAVLRNRGPYPVLVLSGEHGSAKSFLAAILKALLDPNTAPLRALPREDRDLFIAASNGHVLAFDNVSDLPAWISDTLCRLATGGGFAVRQLYTDQDEVLFDAARPTILNGIEDIVTRPDLADRALFLTLKSIPETRRRSEKVLWAKFETEHPRILGALLDAVAEGLTRLPETRLEKLPRMADFALWATACETAIWDEGTFWAAYCGNRDEAVEGIIDADAIATAVRALMGPRTVRTVRTQTAADLLGALAEVAGERVAKSKTWPDGPRALGGRLRRAAPLLRKTGIEIDFVREGRARTRMIVITAEAIYPAPERRREFASASSARSASVSKTYSANDIEAPHPRPQNGGADANRLGADANRPRDNPLETTTETVADGADANFPTQSGQAPGGIPFVMTNDMCRRLRELGYSGEAVRAMTPAHAWQLLEEAATDNEAQDDLMPGEEVAL